MLSTHSSIIWPLPCLHEPLDSPFLIIYPVLAKPRVFLMGCSECFQMFVYLLCSNCKRVYYLLGFVHVAPLFIYFTIFFYLCISPGCERKGWQCGADGAWIATEVSVKITLTCKESQLLRKHEVPYECHYRDFFPSSKERFFYWDLNNSCEQLTYIHI